MAENKDIPKKSKFSEASDYNIGFSDASRSAALSPVDTGCRAVRLPVSRLLD